MKISCFVLWVISGALGLAARDAAASNPALQQSEAAANTLREHPSDATSSDGAKPPVSSVRTGQVQRRAAKANHVPLPASAAKTNRPKHPSKSQARPAATPPRLQPQSRLSHHGVVTKKGSIQSKPGSSTPVVQRQTLFPSSSLSLNNVRHRGPNPAAIGGGGTSKPGETGAIDGSRMSRKP